MINNVSVIGIGKLGLCLSLTLENSGFNVVGVDVNSDYVEKLNNKTFLSQEEQVNERLAKSKNFFCTTNIDLALKHSNLFFIVVATPSLPNGRYDHTQIDNLVNILISKGKQENAKHLVINCTTMPKYCDNIQDKLKDLNWTVSYNPEFIAQGTVIRDQEYPDMVLIGEANKESGDLIQFIYQKFTKNNPQIHRMSRTEAELCKLSLNCFLTTKIAYTNMIGDIAIASGCDPQIVLNAVSNDSRVGKKLTKYGYGFGGPCFPRDNRALGILASDLGIDAKISKATDEMNKLHIQYQVDNFLKSKKTEFKTTSVTYKPESTLLDESQQLEYAIMLAKNGIKVTIQERKNIIEQVKKLYGDLFVYEEL
jgi:UDPglucose 6-dehydrogenase